MTIKLIALAATLMMAVPALAQDEGSSVAPMPSASSNAASIRLIPVAGASSFTTATTLQDPKFNQGFSAGLLADFGSEMWTFETGVLSLNSTQERTDNTTSVTVNNWAIPLLAKLNFSGHPHSTVFLKAGAMPFQATGSGNNNTNFDLMAVGGIGGHIPLGTSTSILLDASYNRLFTNNGSLTNYQGIALLAGLSLNI